MQHDIPVTELIAALQSDDGSAFTELYQHFLDQARRVARQKMTPQTAVRSSPTTVAMQALRECLDKGRVGTYKDRDGLQKLLYVVVERRAFDAARDAKAGKRDVRRESQTDVKNAPSAKSIADSLAVEVVQTLLDVPEETLGVIRLLGVLNEYTAGQIQQMIEPLTGKEKVPSLRTIQLVIARAKLELKEKFGALDDEP